VCSTDLNATTRNLDLLTRYLVPVFLAQDFAITCRVNDPEFLSELPHGAQTVDEFSRQIKKELTDGLTDQEANTVVFVAANTARDAARDEMRKLSPNYPELPAKPLNYWCRSAARPFILKVLVTDQRQHKQFLKLLKRAARDP